MKASDLDKVQDLLGDRAGFVRLLATLQAGAALEVSTGSCGYFVKVPATPLRQAAVDAATAEKEKLETELRALGITEFDADYDDYEGSEAA